MPLFGPPNVINLRNKRNYKGLIKALSYKKYWKVRFDAAHELGRLGSYWDRNKIPAKKIVSPLISTLLNDEDSLVRRSAAEALGNIRDKRAVEPLIAALDDNNDKVRHSAAEALGHIGDKRALEPLIERMNKNSSAMVALGLIGDKRAVKPLIAYIQSVPSSSEAIKALGNIRDPRAVRPLLEAYREASLHHFGRKYAREVKIGGIIANALVSIGEPAIDSLVAAIRDPDPNSAIRNAAARALVKIKPERAVEPLIAALKDKNDGVRINAAKFLGEIGDERAVAPLVANLPSGEKEFAKALDKLKWHPDDGEAGAAYWAAKGKWSKCIQIGQAAVESLILALKRGEEGAAEALGEIGDERAVEPLIANLTIFVKTASDALDKLKWYPDDGEAGAAYWAAKGKWSKCIQIGQPAVEPLISALKRGEEGAAEALGEIGDERAVEPLISGLHYYVPGQPDYEEDPWKYDSDECKTYRVRTAVVKALGKLGDPRAVKPIRRISENLEIYDREIKIGWGYVRFKKEFIEAASETLNMIGKESSR